MKYPRNDMLKVLRSQVRVRVRFKATAIRRVFELYECLLEVGIITVFIVWLVVCHTVAQSLFSHPSVVQTKLLRRQMP